MITILNILPTLKNIKIVNNVTGARDTCVYTTPHIYELVTIAWTPSTSHKPTHHRHRSQVRPPRVRLRRPNRCAPRLAVLRAWSGAAEVGGLAIVCRWRTRRSRLVPVVRAGDGCSEAPVTISRTATGKEEGSEVKQTYDQFVEKIHTET